MLQSCNKKKHNFNSRCIFAISQTAHWEMPCARGSANFYWLRKFLQVAKSVSLDPLCPKRPSSVSCPSSWATLLAGTQGSLWCNSPIYQCCNSAMPWVIVSVSNIIQRWIHCKCFVDSTSCFLEISLLLKLIPSQELELIFIQICDYGAEYLFGLHECQRQLKMYKINK